jgi:hypothetical protein
MTKLIVLVAPLNKSLDNVQIRDARSVALHVLLIVCQKCKYKHHATPAAAERQDLVDAELLVEGVDDE